MYPAAADAVLVIHLLFILWVIFGGVLTRGRPLLTAVHLVSCIWGVLVEILPLTCPLSVAETWLEVRAGVPGYHGGFLLHYLDLLVYPDVPPLVLSVAAVIVGAANFVVYWNRWHRRVQ
jgi:hypothetical protein